MIPLQLTIKGLYSYQEKQSIDFTKLTSASIFGIFGTVGSGKSSILEAITFALYGKTERLNLSGDNRNYNMMNLKSDELFIEFRFIAGKEGSEFLITVKGRRNSKKFDDVKSLDRLAYRLLEKEIVPVTFDSVENAIGLSYENFKRTIIIPQGKFQEFLQLGKADRTQMMKELFSLEKFELFFKVSGIEKKNDEQLNILEGQLKSLGDANPEQLEMLDSFIALSQQKVQTLIEKFDEQQKKKLLLDNLKELKKREIQVRSRLATLNQQQEQIKKLEYDILSFEYCLIHFKPLLDSSQELQLQIEALKKDLAHESAQLNLLETELEKQVKGFEQVKNTYDKRHVLQQQVEELEKILLIIKERAALDKLSRRIQDGSQTVSTYEKQIAERKNELEKTALTLNSLGKELNQTAVLHVVKAWFEKQEHLHKQLQDLQNEKKKLTELELKLKQEVNALKSRKLSQELSWEHLTELPALIAASKKTLENKEAVLNRQIEQAQVQSKLAAYAEQLSDGTPCPLCGSTSHPQVFNPEQSAHKLETWLQEREKLKVFSRELEFLLNQAAIFEHKFATNNEQQVHLEQKSKAVENQIRQHQKLFEWEKYSTKELLQQAFDEAKIMQEQLLILEQKQEKMRLIQNQEQIDLERYKKAVDEFKMQQQALKSRVETLSTQLHNLQWDEWKNKELSVIEAEMETRKKAFSEAELNFEKAGKQLEELKHSKTKKQERISGLNKSMQNTTRDWETKNQQLQSKIQQSEFNDLEQIKKVLEQTLDLDLAKQQIETYKEQMAAATQQLADISQAINKQDYSEKEHQALIQSIEELELNIKHSEKQLIEAQTKLNKLTSDLVQLAKLKEEQSRLQLRAEQIKTLKNLFKGNGFVNYISTVHLQHLCKIANERFFKLTGQKLSLEITADNNFQVRDFLNGGKVRHIKTLSGGQTFQASLSLALALADNVNKLSESKENFFFLDEGFGNLDRESLRVVFDTLKTLRSENRIVGIISHVEELQHEIDAHIRIHHDEERGSLIESAH
ncbi:MAG: hypothetical protein CVU09_15905 [Bacteroidetes bacterium HGW-Bacteroidetes-4]|jgi:exonuclease SbcC|nr:MAG: hypothetical protein CVU09_15905 [Bacteroidetes bacterium HGW-Bacteroidetes-4]